MGCTPSKTSGLTGKQPKHNNGKCNRNTEGKQSGQPKYNEDSYPECVAFTFEEASELRPRDPLEMWAIVKGTSDLEGIQIEPVKNRKGWRTIRIFVSSTFKDFHQEREVLVKEVSKHILAYGLLRVGAKGG